jgi:RNA polymerase sigma-70 factor, ECF subfamily
VLASARHPIWRDVRHEGARAWQATYPQFCRFPCKKSLLSRHVSARETTASSHGASTLSIFGRARTSASEQHGEPPRSGTPDQDNSGFVRSVDRNSLSTTEMHNCWRASHSDWECISSALPTTTRRCGHFGCDCLVGREKHTTCCRQLAVLDEHAFAARLTGSYQRLWLIAAAITGDRTEADDVVQEAALVALRKLDEFDVGTNFAAWMSQIVRLTAFNHVRKISRRNTTPTDPLTLDRATLSLPHSGDDPRSPVDGAGRLAMQQTAFDDDVLSALASVGDIARACLLLRTVHQLSYAEIADTLQIPAGTVMSHVHRARQTMRERLRNRQDECLVPKNDNPAT